MYHVIAFKQGQDPKRVWIKEDQQILKMVEEGYSIYRTGTDQVPVVIVADPVNELVWKDAKAE